MKLLIINPNISKSVSDLIEKEANRVAAKKTQIAVRTAPFGVGYIETNAEALIGGYAALNLLAEHGSEYDAAIIAAFGDPGLTAAQEISEIPVVGLSSSAFMTACLAGERFSIIAISKRIVPWYRGCVASNGVSDRLASIRSLSKPLGDVSDIQSAHRSDLTDLCMQAVEEDNANTIIIAGAPLAGLANSLKSEVSVPLIDGVSCAVKQAELLVNLGVRRPAGAREAILPSKPQSGLSSELAALMTTSS